MKIFDDLMNINLSAFHMFDLIVLGILGLSMVFGLFRGFLKSALSFAGWVLSFILATQFSDKIVYLFEKYTPSHAMADIASVAALFVVFAIIIAICNGVLLLILSPLAGGIIDRSLGLFFGLARGVFLVSFLFYFGTIILPSLNVKSREDVFEDNSKLPKWAKNAETLLLASRGAHLVGKYIPQKFKKELQQSIDESTESSGSLSAAVTNADKVKKANSILSMLPEKVLDEIPNEEIIALQDAETTYAHKIQILESILEYYKTYIDKKLSEHATQSNIKKYGKEFDKTLKAVEAEIKRYRDLIHAESEEAHHH